MNPYPSNLNLENNRQLIASQDNYVLDRKLLTVHSEDRDIAKWTHVNEFEITCPQSYVNIQSMRLVDISIPYIFYNFSNDLQNTKFSFTRGGDPSLTVTIDSGYYTGELLAKTMTYKMNLESELQLGTAYNYFYVIYNTVTNKITIANNHENFDLLFNVQETYDISCQSNQSCPSNLLSQQSIISYYNRYNKWGFPAYIGFTCKQTYSSSQCADISGLLLASVEPPSSWTTSVPKYCVESPYILDITGETVIYFEVEKYNHYDELIPWADSSKATLHERDPKFYAINTEPKYVSLRGSGTNSAFAKIPISINMLPPQILDVRNGIVHYEPPIERISKFKFRFRYHDGKLVNFQNIEINFTLEINQLKNEVIKRRNIRIPAAYLL